MRLRSATGDEMEVTGSIVVPGKCGEEAVEITALVADRATKSLCSATVLLSADMASTCDRRSSSFSTHEEVAYHLRGVASETTLRYACQEEHGEINAITLSNVEREVESLKSEVESTANRTLDRHER